MMRGRERDAIFSSGSWARHLNDETLEQSQDLSLTEDLLSPCSVIIQSHLLDDSNDLPLSIAHLWTRGVSAERDDALLAAKKKNKHTGTVNGRAGDYPHTNLCRNPTLPTMSGI